MEDIEWTGSSLGTHSLLLKISAQLHREAIIGLKAIRKDVCEKINIAEGILKKGDPELVSSNGTQDVDHGQYRSVYTKPWPTTLTADWFGSEDTRISGHHTFCVPRASGPSYVVYHVVYVK